MHEFFQKSYFLESYYFKIGTSSEQLLFQKSYFLEAGNFSEKK